MGLKPHARTCNGPKLVPSSAATAITKGGRRVAGRLAGDEEVVGLDVKVVDTVNLEHLPAVASDVADVKEQPRRYGLPFPPTASHGLLNDCVGSRGAGATCAVDRICE